MCLVGLFTHGLLDTHFANRGRQGRMIKLMADTRTHPVGSTRAFGIDENTALVVTGPWSHRVGEVIGERGVYVFDTAHSVLPMSTTDTSSVTSSLFGIRTHRLSVGDRIDLNTLAVSPASYKRAMAGRETSEVAKTSTNVFGEGTFEFDTIATSLFSSKSHSTVGLTMEASPQYSVVLDKTWSTCMQSASATVSGTSLDAMGLSAGANTIAQGFDGVNPNTGLYAYSYADLCINISPVAV